MKNKQIIDASCLIADIDPALAAVWLEQPFRRHDIVTAFHRSLSITSAYKHLADGIAVTLRSAIDSTKPCTCHEIADGPVPNYCAKHDGDYSSFLALHNCD